MHRFKKWYKRKKLHLIVVYIADNKLKRVYNASSAQKYTARTVAGEKESSHLSNINTLGYAVNNATKNTSNTSTTKISTRKKQFI